MWLVILSKAYAYLNIQLSRDSIRMLNFFFFLTSCSYFIIFSCSKLQILYFFTNSMYFLFFLLQAISIIFLYYLLKSLILLRVLSKKTSLSFLSFLALLLLYSKYSILFFNFIFIYLYFYNYYSIFLIQSKLIFISYSLFNSFYSKCSLFTNLLISSFNLVLRLRKSFISLSKFYLMTTYSAIRDSLDSDFSSIFFVREEKRLSSNYFSDFTFKDVASLSCFTSCLSSFEISKASLAIYFCICRLKEVLSQNYCCSALNQLEYFSQSSLLSSIFFSQFLFQVYYSSLRTSSDSNQGLQTLILTKSLIESFQLILGIISIRLIQNIYNQIHLLQANNQIYPKQTDDLSSEDSETRRQ